MVSPKSRGLQCKMSSTRLSWVFLVAVVATFGLVAAKSVDQQQHELLSCEHVSNFFSSINVTIKPANKNQGNVCGGPCCDNQVESQLEVKATKNFERLVKHHTRSQRGHWEHAADLYRDYLLQLSRQSENKTLNLFSTVYRKMSPLSREPILELYETIRNHLMAVSTDDLGLVTDKFFRNLFPVAYHHAVVHADKDVDFHSDYKNCLIHTYDELKPFGDIPQQLSSSLVASVSVASVFLRVLREGAEVLNQLDKLGTENLQGSCKAALLKMNYCASCKRHNHNHAKPCAGLCKNVMRGCLMQYIGILNQDWFTFTDAIVPLINAVRSTDGIEAEIKGLDGKLSSAIMHAMENGPQLEVKVKKACGTPSLMQNDNLAGAYEQSAAPTLHSNKWILAPINEMLQFEVTIDKNKDLFLQLSSTLCDDEDYHSGDENCWTGTTLGDYTHEVASTKSQKYNPEVPYSSANEESTGASPQLQMLIDRLIAMKNAATRALTNNMLRSDSDKMLSDMAEGSGSNHYGDYDSNEDEEYGENGSGSGEGPGRQGPNVVIRDEVQSNFTPSVNPSHAYRISVSSSTVMATCAAAILALVLRH